MKRWPAVGALCLLAGCTGPAIPTSGRQELTGDPPAVNLEEVDAMRRDSIFRWELTGPAGREGWYVEDAQGARRLADSTAGIPPGDALRLPPSWSGKWLERRLGVAAEGLDLVIVELANGGAQLAQLCWARAGEWMVAERCVSSGAGLHSSTVALELRSHPEWRGRIEWLAFSFHFTGSEEVGLRWVEGYRLSPPPAPYEEVVRATLGRETRTALATVPGTVIRRRVIAAEGAQLRLAIGASHYLRSPLRYRITVAGHPNPLLDRIVEPGAERWEECVVGLDALGAGEVELELHVTATAGPTALAFWGSPTVWTAPAQQTRPDVILVSVDTVRADHLSLYGYHRPTWPRLERWARQRGVTFEQVVTAAPWTLPSHASLFTGLYAFNHGVNLSGRVPAEVPVVAEAFRDAGYSTHGDAVGPILAPEYGMDRGFETFRVRGDIHHPEEQAVELASGIDGLLEWLASRPDGHPVFVFFHTYEAHSPFVARQPYFGRFAPGVHPVPLNTAHREEGDDKWPGYRLVSWERQRANVEPLEAVADRRLATALYDSGLAYIDEQLDRLLRALEAAGRLDRTVVAITSDHGESLLDRGLVGHNHLYDDNLLVPLLVLAPRAMLAPGRRVGAQVRTIDIAPTLLELAGVAGPRMDGRSLVPLLRRDAEFPREAWAYSRSTHRGVALRTADRKVIVSDSALEPWRGTTEVFDLVRDPRELANVGDRLPDRNAARSRALRPLLGARASTMLVANSSDETFRLMVAATAMEPVKVTSGAPDEVRCSWTDQALRCEVAPRSRFHLAFHELGVGTMRVEMRSAAGRDVSTVALTHSAVAGRQLVNGRWTGSEEPPGVGWLLHAQPQDGGDMGERERELRALGYLR